MGKQRSGRGPINLKPLPPARVEIINLIDVMITLIAFFMLTTVFAQEQSRLQIMLPQSKQAESAAVPSQLLLEMDEESRIYVNGSIVSPAGLKRILQQTSPDTVVAIRGDQAVTYQALIDLLDLLKQYHFTKLSFEVKKIENES
ncbi:MAG: ExbD/TolR family protein [Bacteroidota bacterium]